MRTISAEKVRETISQLCATANFCLRKDVLAALKAALKKENSLCAKKFIGAIIENAAIAKKEKLAICQDTGLPCVFVEIGQGVQVKGDLRLAITQGVAAGYRKNSLRNSIVRDPLLRGMPGFNPCVTHVELVKDDKLKITVMPKGFGCENKTQLKMFKPTAKKEDIKKFIIDAVKAAGPDACPPYVIGVGIGGSAEFACLIAKKALLRRIGLQRKTSSAAFEQELLKDINRLDIGPMGLGGKTTALAVHIEKYPTHIAGLPVCVSISCHALRSATRII